MSLAAIYSFLRFCLIVPINRLKIQTQQTDRGPSCLQADPDQAGNACTIPLRRHPRASRFSEKRQKASYTVEASFVMPMVVFAFIFALVFFRILSVQWGVAVSLNEAAREVALAGGDSTDTVSTESEEETGKKKQEHPVDTGMTALAVSLADADIVSHDTQTKYVSFGLLGINLLDSKVDDRDVELVASYTIPMPADFFGLGKVRITQRAKTHRWVGFDPAEGVGKDGDTVYVTEYGVAYHRSLDCSYLAPSIRSVTKSAVGGERNSSGHIYYPCPLCGGGGDICYITTYGENYHSSISCSGLKRTIRSVTQEEAEAEGFHACGKCAN